MLLRNRPGENRDSILAQPDWSVTETSKREEREYRESIRAEPDWSDTETSKAWLEERYPLLDDTTLGSPLFRYIKNCVKDPKAWRGSKPMFLASMLAFYEMWRFSGETGLGVASDLTGEILYPDYGWPRLGGPEPEWTDIEASRVWLEQRHPLGSSERGSPLFQYMKTCYASGDSRGSPMKHLGSMLTEDEWTRFLRHCPIPDNQRHHGEPDNVLYPEYDERMWPNERLVLKVENTTPLVSPNRPRTTSLLQPAAISAGSYLPHLSTQTPSSSRSTKRKGDDRDGGPSEHPASKRRRKPSDSGEGVVMPAKPHNFYEGTDSPKNQNDGLMPPPPRPQQQASGVIRIGELQDNEESSSATKKDTIGVTKTPPRPTPQIEEIIDAKENPDAMDLDSDVSGHQAEAPPTKMPLADSSGKRGIEEVSDEQSASSASKRRRTSPDSVGDSSPVFGPPVEWERSIENVENAPPTTSSPKRQRTPPHYSGNDLSPSSPFDPPERSTPTPFPRLDNPQSDAIEGRRDPEATNPDDPPIPNLRDHEAALNGGSETQHSGKDGPVPPEPNLQNDFQTPIKEDPDTIIESERPIIYNRDDGTKRSAISVVIPVQSPQHQPAAYEDLSPDELTLDIPVVRRKRKRGRKLGTNGRKAPKPEPQFDQRKRKPPTNGRRNRQPKQEHEAQAYVGRLRSGVGERKHDKPSRYSMPP